MADPPFDKVLVANRGEIACRIIATLRRMGIASVAVWSDADRGSAHVALADEAVRVGTDAPGDSYLRIDRILEAVAVTGAEAVHPGYGFLSESPAFARAVEDADLVFIGPTPAQLTDFGDKARARALARAAGVPLLAGTGVLETLEQAQAEAGGLGFPVLLKATAGGGGIGMARCDGPDDLAANWDRVARLGLASFGSSAAFLERFLPVARHVEVQIAGDGEGTVVVLGDRDCSVQRRRQKVIEEAPAFGLPADLRRALAESARHLGRSVRYRSVGTVEFLVDPVRQEHHFLEVNTRLQVEHGVTELVCGVDLVEWMIRIAAGDRSPFAGGDAVPRGSATEARIYAEDPAQDFRPSAGLLTEVRFPGGPDRTDVRVDAWVATGTEVSPYYDPLLAKVLARGDDRPAAIDGLRHALAETRLAGIETNREWLLAVLDDELFRAAEHGTTTFEAMAFRPSTLEVVASPGAVTVQDWPGRLGYWSVGVPPSGPMDDLSFRLGNRVVGNHEGAAGLEIEVFGPTIRFHRPVVACLAGAPMPATLDGEPVAAWTPLEVPAGAVLACGSVSGPGARAYLLFGGGVDVPRHLGSRATFTLGGFGGHAGRPLRAGDVLRLAGDVDPTTVPAALVPAARPGITDAWELGVLDGPHADPEFLTAEGIADLYTATWEVHYQSARTGVRLVGPPPRWARRDGGEAGLHPSNIHDAAYAVGTIDLTGDMPIILGPDGPSLGGFVCPLTVVAAERWKLGQLRAGDRVRFRSLTVAEAAELDTRRARQMAGPDDAGASGETTVPGGRPPGDGMFNALPPATVPAGAPDESPDPGGEGGVAPPPGPRSSAVLGREPATWGRPAVTYRQSGDRYVLVEYGDMVLDLDLRVRAHLLHLALEAAAVPGVVDITPGIRSLQVHVDGVRLTTAGALGLLRELEEDIAGTDAVAVPSRIVHLPLSWDDPATRTAIETYMRVVRDDAPWCPSNLEFIRRINGLASIGHVHDVVFGASYLVLGLGDVYLGAPVATPVDPRHRLVTTKYNPARTWTPENAVGIGGAYLCVYGMEGPGGYQFVGRTVPVWSRHRPFRQTTTEQPWLLRFFDQLRFHPVSAEELLDLRADMVAGRGIVQIEEDTFDLAAHHRFLDTNRLDIEAFKARQQEAFAAERGRWEASGELDRAKDAVARADSSPGAGPGALDPLPDGATAVVAPLTARVWQLEVADGDRVQAGQRVAMLEAMKMEVAVVAERSGRVVWLGCEPGQVVEAGQSLVGVAPDE